MVPEDLPRASELLVLKELVENLQDLFYLLQFQCGGREDPSSQLSMLVKATSEKLKSSNDKVGDIVNGAKHLRGVLSNFGDESINEVLKQFEDEARTPIEKADGSEGASSVRRGDDASEKEQAEELWRGLEEGTEKFLREQKYEEAAETSPVERQSAIFKSIDDEVGARVGGAKQLEDEPDWPSEDKLQNLQQASKTFRKTSGLLKWNLLPYSAGSSSRGVVRAEKKTGTEFALIPVFFATTSLVPLEATVFSNQLRGIGLASGAKLPTLANLSGFVRNECGKQCSYGHVQVGIPAACGVDGTWDIVSIQEKILPRGIFLGLNSVPEGSAWVKMIRGKGDAALVYVHGFLTNFRDALHCAAEMAYAAAFKGPVVVFNWPSCTQPFHYWIAESRLTWTAPDLTDVLEQLSAAKIVLNILGHSLGCRLLTYAFPRAFNSSSPKLLCKELVLAAGDIDRDEFLKHLPRMAACFQRLTLYCNANDNALWFSST